LQAEVAQLAADVSSRDTALAEKEAAMVQNAAELTVFAVVVARLVSELVLNVSHF
jgi:hypothetical protein